MKAFFFCKFCALKSKHLIKRCFPVLLCLVLAACSSSQSSITSGGRVVLPTSTRSQTKKPPRITTFTSKERLKEIGEENHLAILQSQPLYEDPELLDYVREIGQKVAALSNEPDLGYQFFILDSSEPNASAAPGGYIYITRGMLFLLTSEDQLAAVLGHEVAHVAAEHHGRRGNVDVLGKGAGFVAGVATVLATGSAYAAEEIEGLSSLWATTASAGFGRELELEADGLASQYARDAGYDPLSMFEALSALKDMENLGRTYSQGGGSYHGSFASHPRTDKRLQEIIAAVSTEPKENQQSSDDQRFRSMIDGLPVGESVGSGQQDERNRYYQTLLGYTLIFPDEWSLSETTTTVTADNQDGAALRVEARRLSKNIEPRVFLREELGISDLQKSEALNQYRLIGHTGLTTSESGRPERVAVIYLGSRAFIFRGEVEQGGNFDVVDQSMLDSIRTFRAIQTGETNSGSEVKIKYVQASEFFDFAVVAQSNKALEDLLRVLNGYYPRGNPEAGEWVKLVE